MSNEIPTKEEFEQRIGLVQEVISKINDPKLTEKCSRLISYLGLYRDAINYLNNNKAESDYIDGAVTSHLKSIFEIQMMSTPSFFSTLRNSPELYNAFIEITTSLMSITFYLGRIYGSTPKVGK